MAAAPFAAHEAGHVTGLLDVAAGFLYDLPHLAGRVPRELLLAAADDLGEPEERLAALRPGDESPAPEGLRRRVRRCLRVALVGVLERPRSSSLYAGSRLSKVFPVADGNHFPPM